MRYLSVCSGIEAATAAWHPLGWSPEAYSEIEPFPSAVLAHHYPDVPNLGDMTKFEEWKIGAVDLLVGGTPCQSFSVAGLRRGLDDPRGNLMLTYGAIADRFKPRWIVWENVPGVLSSNGGRDFGAFLGLLGLLGYGFAYRVLDAQYFGVAQRRRRVFVVGHLGDWRRAAAVLFESESLRWNPPPSREAGQGAAGGSGRGSVELYENHAQDSRVRRIEMPSLNVKAGTGGGNLPILMAHGQGGAEIATDGGAPCLTCNHEAPILAHSLRGEGFDASEDGTGRGTPIVPVAFPANLSGTQRVSTKGLSPSMGAKNPTAVAIRTANTNANGHGVAEEVAHTLDQAQGQAIVQPAAVRRLTPRECERLQGFPDDYTAIPWRGRAAEDCPDGPRYKALGNSMAVPVMAWIGRRIEKIEAMMAGKA